MVAQNPDDWSLPPVDRRDLPVILSQGELLLIDWIICGASRLLPDTEPSYLITSWEHLRLRVWQAVATNAEAQALSVSESDSHVLLAICPTTFRWGMGDDVGFSLKMKLAQFLAPEMFSHDDKDASSGDTPSAGATPKDAGF